MIHTDAIGMAGICHLLFFCLILPLAAVRSARRMDSLPYPPRRRFYISVLIQHAGFIVFSAIVANIEKISLVNNPRNPARSFSIITVFLIATIVLTIPRWKQNVVERERKVFLFMPRGIAEKSLWVLISIAAGIGEEITYRGVMWILLAKLTGSLWVSALIAAAIFAVSHFMQGWSSVTSIFGFALGFHAIVWFTDSLIPAMVMHTLYDVVAGMVYSYYGERFGYPEVSLERSGEV